MTDVTKSEKTQRLSEGSEKTVIFSMYFNGKGKNEKKYSNKTPDS